MHYNGLLKIAFLIDNFSFDETTWDFEEFHEQYINQNRLMKGILTNEVLSELEETYGELEIENFKIWFNDEETWFNDEN